MNISQEDLQKLSKEKNNWTSKKAKFEQIKKKKDLKR